MLFLFLIKIFKIDGTDYLTAKQIYFWNHKVNCRVDKIVGLEWHIKSRNSIIFGYHAVTVDTPLSKPFEQRTPEDQLFST